MHDSKEPKGKSFTVFRSAAEEAEMKSAEQDWANEGGHMSSTSGRVINRPGEDLPFVQSCRTMAASAPSTASRRCAKRRRSSNATRPCRSGSLQSCTIGRRPDLERSGKGSFERLKPFGC